MTLNNHGIKHNFNSDNAVLVGHHIFNLGSIPVIEICVRLEQWSRSLGMDLII